MVGTQSHSIESGAGAPEIEITPQMINAGIDAYHQLDRDFDADARIVADIYRAMASAAKQPPTHAASLGRQSIEQSRWWLP
jgi:hypothetical protein